MLTEKQELKEITENQAKNKENCEGMTSDGKSGKRIDCLALYLAQILFDRRRSRLIRILY